MSGSLRVGGGALRGRRLHAPKGERTRPTSGRLKKSLFDVLGPRVEHARVLDLYAGAGALGIEALSRGASSAVFVERVRAAADAIERSLVELELVGRASVLRRDVDGAVASLETEGARFDVVFADPPYGSGGLETLLAALGRGKCLAADAWVIVEHHHKRDPGERHGTLERFRTLRAGESALSLYELAPA